MKEGKRRRIMIAQKEMRNWLHLPVDIMVILSKLDLVDILFHAQFVCSSWLQIVKDPRIFRSIRVPNSSSAYRKVTQTAYSDLSDRLYPTIRQKRITDKCCRKLFEDAIQRSCGQLIEISLREAAACDDELLRCVSMRPNLLKSLRLATCISEITAKGLVEACKKLPLLEELEFMHDFDVSPLHIEQIGQSCLQLKYFRVFGRYARHICSRTFYDDNLVFAIAENMSQLQDVRLYITSLTNKGLQALFAGCPLLERLDLGDCCFLEGKTLLQRSCQRVKYLTLPSGSCKPRNVVTSYQNDAIRTMVFLSHESQNDGIRTMEGIAGDVIIK